MHYVFELYLWFVQDDNSPVSIFSYTGSNAQDARLSAARNGAKRLRVVRFRLLSGGCAVWSEEIDPKTGTSLVSESMELYKCT